MPSEKRARQRRLRDERRAVEEQRARRRRNYRRGIAAIVVVGIVVGLVAWLSGKSTPTKAATSTTTSAATTTTTPSTTTTEVVPAATANTPACPPAAGSAKRVTAFKAQPALCINPTGVYDATVVTDVGTFVIEMHAANSLIAVNNFVFLARYHFYDGIYFQRVVPGFVVQGGDPTGTGSGGPGYTWTGNTPPTSCEKVGCYPTGSVAMANTTGPSTNSSQYFIVLPGGESQLSGPPNYTLFGTVVSGMSVVEKIGADGSATGTPKHFHKMEKVTISEVSP